MIFPEPDLIVIYFLQSRPLAPLPTDVFQILNCSKLISYLSYFLPPSNVLWQAWLGISEFFRPEGDFTVHDLQETYRSPLPHKAQWNKCVSPVLCSKQISFVFFVVSLSTWHRTKHKSSSNWLLLLFYSRPVPVTLYGDRMAVFVLFCFVLCPTSTHLFRCLPSLAHCSWALRCSLTHSSCCNCFFPCLILSNL